LQVDDFNLLEFFTAETLEIEKRWRFDKLSVTNRYQLALKKPAK
jgi:hypothetical protein